MNDRRKAIEIIGRFGGQRVLVLGDLMLDRYWWGTVERISPEAPVPVVRKQRSSVSPGGAANTAANLAALGAIPALIGITGKDEAASELRAALGERQIDCGHLLTDEKRPTTVKTRIVAHDQHVVRVDDEDGAPVAGGLADQTVALIESLLPEAAAIVISDYGKGFLTPRLLRGVKEAARAAGKPVLIDPKVSDCRRYAGAAVVKPNRTELAALTGVKVTNHEETVQAGLQLLCQLDGASVLVTEGKEGMTLLEPGRPEQRFPTFARQVYDVTGAGDTVIATLAMALISGAPLPQAAWLANVAAGVVVGEVGTAAISTQALLAALNDHQFPDDNDNDELPPQTPRHLPGSGWGD